jgi:aspartyl protease family protein
MTDAQTGGLIWGIVSLLLVVSSLAARRFAVADVAKMGLAWIAIFATFFTVFSFRFEMLTVWNRMKAELSGQSVAEDGTLRVRIGEDGHYSVDAQVNGQTVRFMVDSGATTTSLSIEAARAANVEVDQTGFPVVVETANGMVENRRGRIARLSVGPIARDDFPVLISDRLGDMNLIGMNFLSSLKGWRVEGNELVLNP